MNYLQSFLSTIVYSFYSKKLYASVHHQWQSLPLKYLLLVCLISSSVIAYSINSWVDNIIFSDDADDLKNIASKEEYLDNIIAQIPEVTIKDYTLSTKNKSTYNVLNASGKTILIIDTADILKSIKETQSTFMVTKNNIHFMSNNGQEYILPLQKLLQGVLPENNEPVTLDKEFYSQFLHMLVISETSSYLAGIISFTLYFFLDNLILAAIYALVVTGLMRIEIKFTNSLRLAIIASTPTIVFKTLDIVLPNGLFGYPLVVFFLMQLAYTYYAIDSSRKN